MDPVVRCRQLGQSRNDVQHDDERNDSAADGDAPATPRTMVNIPCRMDIIMVPYLVYPRWRSFSDILRRPRTDPDFPDRGTFPPRAGSVLHSIFLEQMIEEHRHSESEPERVCNLEQIRMLVSFPRHHLDDSDLYLEHVDIGMEVHNGKRRTENKSDQMSGNHNLDRLLSGPISSTRV